jgi:hypothetical protein
MGQRRPAVQCRIAAAHEIRVVTSFQRDDLAVLVKVGAVGGKWPTMLEYVAHQNN